jgi:hypothetical protein
VRIIRAKLSGPEARLGDVPAVDVARVIIGLERALARAAYVALGTSRGPQPGRHRAAIERASRLRFVGVEAGSVVELLALPDVGTASDDELPLTLEDLSGAAFAELTRAIQGGADDTDVELAAAVAQLGDELGIGERNDQLSLGEVGADLHSEPSNVFIIDGGVRQRMRAISRRPLRAQDDTLVGVLVEADFERRTARLQPPIGGAVTVTFTDEMADELYRALRQPAQLQGHVRYDAKTATAKDIELHRVSRAEQLALDGQAFFERLTIEDLAARQGIPGPVLDPSELSDPELTADERAAFLASLADA